MEDGLVTGDKGGERKWMYPLVRKARIINGAMPLVMFT
jgi:hypothetical protein